MRLAATQNEAASLKQKDRQFAHLGLDSRFTFCAVPHVDFAMRF